MVYGLKYESKETNLNIFNWLDKNSDLKTIHSLESTSFSLNKVENLLDHRLMLKDHLNPEKPYHLLQL